MLPPGPGTQIPWSPRQSICKLIWKEENKIKRRQPQALPETGQFHSCSSQLPLPAPWASTLPGKVTAACVQEPQHPLPGHQPVRVPEREVNLIKGVLSPLTDLLSAPGSWLQENFHG